MSVKSFIELKTGCLRRAHSIRACGSKTYIQFVPNSQEYVYSTANVMVVSDDAFDKEHLVVYCVWNLCGNCKKLTRILTYVLFPDGTNDNLVYPWDIPRLDSSKSLFSINDCHKYNYPITVLGDDASFDELMIESFPQKISMISYGTESYQHPVNLCEHCGSIQDNMDIRWRFDNSILKNEEIEIFYFVPRNRKTSVLWQTSETVLGLVDDNDQPIQQQFLLPSKAVKDDLLGYPRYLLVYSLALTCHQCEKDVEALTYMLFANGNNRNLAYPWDRERLNECSPATNQVLHSQYGNIEFYPIKVLGSDEKLDPIMLNRFSDRISMEYSNTEQRVYTMNICRHCGAKQGKYYIYEKINKLITEKSQIPIHITITL